MRETESETGSPSSRGRRSPVLVLAIMLALASGLAALYLLSRSPDGKEQADRSLSQNEIVADVEPSGDGSAQGGSATPVPAVARDREAAEAWAGLPDEDVGALRAFLAEHGESNFAAEAQVRIREFERLAWDDVGAAEGVLASLSAVEAYVSGFPDGEMQEEAHEIGSLQRAALTEAQIRLAEAGFEAGADGHVVPSTRQAIMDFQEKASLNQTGDLDEATLKALRAFVPKTDDKGSAPVDAVIADSLQPEANIDVPTEVSDVQPEVPAPKPFRDCPVCPEMVRLPAGKFLMGDMLAEGDSDEAPIHLVTFERPIAIGIYEVRFEEWDACVAEGACAYSPDDNGWGRRLRPVINVTVRDTEAFLEWLTAKTGYRYRLPSEAEWEYAARAGTFDAYSGHDLASLCSYGNGAGAESDYNWRNDLCSDAHANQTAPVGSFRPNAFGLYDMMGNVWEWVGDCWHGSYSGATSDGSAWNTECEKNEHVLRGGAFSVDAEKLRVSYRYSFTDKRMPFFGFRVVREEL